MYTHMYVFLPLPRACLPSLTSQLDADWTIFTREHTSGLPAALGPCILPSPLLPHSTCAPPLPRSTGCDRSRSLPALAASPHPRPGSGSTGRDQPRQSTTWPCWHCIAPFAPCPALSLTPSATALLCLTALGTTPSPPCLTVMRPFHAPRCSALTSSADPTASPTTPDYLPRAMYSVTSARAGSVHAPVDVLAPRHAPDLCTRTGHHDNPILML